MKGNMYSIYESEGDEGEATSRLDKRLDEEILGFSKHWGGCDIRIKLW